MPAELAHWRFTADDYHRMAQTGILAEDDRVELIDGELIQISPIDGRHVACVTELTWLLSQRISGEWRVSVHSPVRLSDLYEPQPDVAVVRAREYGDELPVPHDVLLMIEVADTSLSYDRSHKATRLRQGRHR